MAAPAGRALRAKIGGWVVEGLLLTAGVTPKGDSRDRCQTAPRSGRDGSAFWIGQLGVGLNRLCGLDWLVR